MFDNPEKLFIILLIALFIFGPQKLIGLGSSMGKAIREFRGHVREAQDQFHEALAEAQRTEETFTASEPPALPPPEPIVPTVTGADPVPAAQAAAVMPDADAGAAPAEAPGGSASSPAADAAEPSVEDEGPHSLASEPSSHTVLESLQRRT
jgi:TatA/E family protein of Tat protein translocase